MDIYEKNARNLMSKITAWQDVFMAKCQHGQGKHELHALFNKMTDEQIAEYAEKNPEMLRDMAKFIYSTMFRSRLELLEEQGNLSDFKCGPKVDF